VADVTYLLHTLSHKLPKKVKTTVLLLEVALSLPTKALFVSDRHTERSVGGISTLEAISRAKRFHIYLKFLKQLSQCKLYLLKRFRIA
jgi:hypothetical protein